MLLPQVISQLNPHSECVTAQMALKVFRPSVQHHVIRYGLSSLESPLTNVALPFEKRLHFRRTQRLFMLSESDFFAAELFFCILNTTLFPSAWRIRCRNARSGILR